jgi:hypothetical protein
VVNGCDKVSGTGREMTGEEEVADGKEVAGGWGNVGEDGSGSC